MKRTKFCLSVLQLKKTSKIPLIRQIYKRWFTSNQAPFSIKNINCFFIYISTKFPCERVMNSTIVNKLTLTWPLPGGSFVHVTTFYFWLRTEWSSRTGSPPCRPGYRPHQTRPPSAGPSPGVKGHQHVNSIMLTNRSNTDRDLTACIHVHINYIWHEVDWIRYTHHLFKLLWYFILEALCSII